MTNSFQHDAKELADRKAADERLRELAKLPMPKLSLSALHAIDPELAKASLRPRRPDISDEAARAMFK